MAYFLFVFNNYLIKDQEQSSHSTLLGSNGHLKNLIKGEVIIKWQVIDLDVCMIKSGKAHLTAGRLPYTTKQPKLKTELFDTIPDL